MKPVAPDRIAPSAKAARGQRLEEYADDDRDDDSDNGDGRVLAAEVGAGSFLNSGGDLDHPLVAGGHAEHLAAGDDAVEHRDHAADYSDIKQVHEFKLPCS